MSARGLKRRGLIIRTKLPGAGKRMASWCRPFGLVQTRARESSGLIPEAPNSALQPLQPAAGAEHVSHQAIVR